MIIYLLPILSFGIGWLFFFFILKIYFNRNQNSNFNFLALFNAHKEELAKTTGNLVQNKFLESDIIKSKIEDPALMDSIRPGIEKYISYFIEEKLVKKYPIIAMMGGDDIVAKIKTNLLTELDVVIPQILLKYTSTLQEKIALNEIVQKEIMKISASEIQEIILKKANKLFQLIPVLGGIVGLIVGLISIFVLKGNF